MWTQAIYCILYFALIQGSVAGGFLAQPASKYAVLQVPFFCQFPYVLPCLVGAGISVLSLIGKYICLLGSLNVGIVPVLMSANPNLRQLLLCSLMKHYTPRRKRRKAGESVISQIAPRVQTLK